ncbi:MAG: tRNA (N6-threonylcarbamoyladenosine(37)-N6)-methyltransferase TrmO [Thermomicrobiales bacterium]|nr:tRNA (N6-threonylcarbamoyladenosine(37)-N6)-methyltransferase TrmO [Thermomicrobiales bacterium]
MAKDDALLPTRWFRVQAIGAVARAEPESLAHAGYYDPGAESVLEILPRWADALDGLEAYSHLIVVYWLDRAKRARQGYRLRPERRPDMPEVGAFATRTPQRPNPIGLSTPRLLRRDGLMLRVTGIDAWPGTPILDIKGYTPRDDVRPDATVPDWLQRLWGIHDRERERDA